MKKRFVHILCLLSLTFFADAMDRPAVVSGSSEELDILSMPFSELEKRIERERMFLPQQTPLEQFHQSIIDASKAEKFNRADAYDLEQLLIRNITDNPELILQEDVNGNTALHIAAQQGNLQIFKSLLDAIKGTKIPAVKKTNRKEQTVLHVAAFFGNEAIVDEIIDKQGLGLVGPEYLNLKDKEGMTALHWAAAHNRAEVVEKLRAAGANSCTKNNAKAPPILTAARTGHFTIVNMLLQSSVQCLKEKDKEAVLEYAVESAPEELFDRIIAALGTYQNLQGALKHAQELSLRAKTSSRDEHEKTFRSARVAYLEQAMKGKLL